MRTPTGFGWWAAAIRASPRASVSTKKSSPEGKSATRRPISARTASSATPSGRTSAIGWTRMWFETMNSIRASPTPSVGRRHQRNAADGFARFTMAFVRVLGIRATSISSTVTSAFPS